MWGAIIQAIDHAAERTQKGFRSGIDVANSQHGGAASVKNSDVSTSKPSETKDVTEEEDKASTEQSSAGSATGAMKGGASAGASDILGGAAGSAGAGGEGVGAVGGGLSSIISDERLKARELANSVKRKWHEKVLSDENAKNSRNVSSSAKRYATNASGGVAEAGRIATGQSSGGNRIITNDNTAFKTASDIQSEVNRKDASKKAEESITK
jgi:hypothetical protein